MNEPSPELFQKLSAAVAASPAPTRPQALRRGRVVLLLGLLPILALALKSLVRNVERGSARWAVAVVWALIALALALRSRVRPAGGPLGTWVRAAGLWAPLLMIGAVFALYATGAGEGLNGGQHLSCFVKSVGLSLLPLAAFLYVERRSDPVAPRVRGALLGATAGVVGAIPFYLECMAPSTVEHATAGHVLPALIIAMLGGVLGARILALD